ncbi:hypothetical protein ACQPX6_28740 [Actinomycetospora sp. CA-101289]|uniref:hypothetical protein n=1 Tax=Actinomycetospora sp. CA-101289 TaxID=3239893 RepID=UPI003D95B881
MRVLESPVTWITLAAVLVVVALLLFLVAALRRRRARRAAAAAAWPPPAIEPALGERPRPAAATPEPDPEPETAPIDVDALRARLGAAAPAPDPVPTGEEPRRPRHAASDEPGRDAPPPPAPESAEDRLLAVLLHDPRAAVEALATADRDTGPSAAALLRAGLTPAQVARLVGVDEHRLATVVAQGLGLLADGQVAGATGENRTDDPGRSWANTASSAGSTTPTTG